MLQTRGATSVRSRITAPNEDPAQPINKNKEVVIVVVQFLTCVQLSMIPWTVARQASLSLIMEFAQLESVMPSNLLELKEKSSIESVMPSNLLELKEKPSQVGTQGQLFSHHLTDLTWQSYPGESVASLMLFQLFTFVS